MIAYHELVLPERREDAHLLPGASSSVRPHAGRLVHRVSGPPELVARLAAGLPPGAAQAEATVARALQRGMEVVRAEPGVVGGARALAAFCGRWGASSVDVLRADASLVEHMQVGGWFDARAMARTARRATPRAILRGVPGRLLRGETGLKAHLDAFFWTGVRARASDAEWRLLTRSSYVIFVVHRLAGRFDVGGEDFDMAPEKLRRAMRFLRRLGFRVLDARDVLGAAGTGASLPRRGIVLSMDDALAGSVDHIATLGVAHPVVFVPTALVGANAPFAEGVHIASWHELKRAKQAGVRLAPHSRRHPRLTEVGGGDALRDELKGGLEDLLGRGFEPVPVLAYPHGAFDARVIAATRTAGYRAAVTTRPGKNGAGTNRYALRRTPLFERDTLPAVLWKAITGDLLPARWERRLKARTR